MHMDFVKLQNFRCEHFAFGKYWTRVSRHSKRDKKGIRGETSLRKSFQVLRETRMELKMDKDRIQL